MKTMKMHPSPDHSHFFKAVFAWVMLTCTFLLGNNPPTGAVTISGTVQVGQTLTVANTLADADGIGTITYQWHRDGIPITMGGTLKNKVNGVDGLNSPQNLTISADQKHLYVTGHDDDTISWFDRNASSGILSYGGSLKNGVGGVYGLESPHGHVLSTDDRHAYVCTASGYLVWLDRNSSTGALTFGGFLQDGVGGVDGLDISRNIIVSPDGLHIYVTAAGTESSISWFTRDTTSGIPTFGGILKKDADGINGLNAAYGLTITQDGDHIYLTGSQDDSVSWFTRNKTSGALAHEGTFKSIEMNGARNVIVSDDQNQVYVTGYADDSISWFDRNASTGALTLIGTSKDGENGINDLGGAMGVSLSPDQKHIYTVSFQDNAVNWFDRNTSTGVLTYGGTLKDGLNGVDGLEEAQNITVSKDGSYVYVSAEVGDTVSWFPRNPITGALSYGPISGSDYTLTENDLGSVITVKASLLDGASFEHNVTSTETISVQPPYEPSQPINVVDLNSSVNLEMIWVESGTFTMGSPVTEIGRNSSETEHNVTLTQGFYLGKYEVTQAQYEAVMKGHSDANATPSRWSGNPNRPVEKISWNDIQLFLELLNEQEAENIPAGWEYILPSEAQWEYACRGGTITSYSWGNTMSESDANWMNTNDDNQTQNVGQYSANPWGFFDMHGNVWEWTNDWKASYSENNVTDPKGPDMGSEKIVRGGSFASHYSYIRSAYRHAYETNATYSGIGFRLALLNANHAPSFHEKNATFSIQENQTTIGNLFATDMDLGGVKAISSFNHSLFIDSNGSMWAMGPNRSGALGDGSNYPSPTPKKVIDKNVTAVAAGYSHSLFIKKDGSLWSTGSNWLGQLGDSSNNNNRSSPVRVVDENVHSVAAGAFHSLFLKKDGSLWAMGQNENGQLGDGTNTDRSTPVKVMDANVTLITAGYYNSFFLKNNGSLWAMGKNGGGQFGNGTFSSQASPVEILSTGIVWVTSGENHSLFIKDDGSLWAMGQNGWGQLGNGTTSWTTTPVQIVQSGVVKAACGAHHSIFLKEDGSLWAMGRNDHGQLGDNTTTNRFTPVKICENVINISSGNDFNLIVRSDGTLETFGLNTTASLGDGAPFLYDSPVEIESSGVTAVFPGNIHSLFLKEDGSLWGMGSNNAGQLGNGNHTSLAHPGKLFDENISQAAAGEGHSLFLKTDGSLWGTGTNWSGQLGDGTTISQNLPVKILDSGVVQVEASRKQSFFIKDDGSLWAMGNNEMGQLGDGTTVDRLSPVQIVDENVTSVKTGYQHTLFLKNDGSLWAMGNNQSGQFGDGTTTIRLSPVKIIDENVTGIGAGWAHSAFIKNDGSLWGMGNNWAGQLGDGTNSSHLTPVKIEDENVTAIATQLDHTLYLKDDGSLWGMGNNHLGAIGLGSHRNTKQSPVKISDGNVTAIGAGELYSLFVKDDGSLWGMGYDGTGQLGTGRSLWRTSPHRITNPVPHGDRITFSIIEGADASLLEINASSGELSFKTTPDFERLQDANGDNIFEVVVRATDSYGLFSDQNIEITLSDINEAPTFGGSDTITLSESNTPISITPTWDRTYGGNHYEDLRNGILTSDGGYIFVGSSESNATGDKSEDSRGDSDYWVIKVDAYGKKLWDRTYGGSGNDTGVGAIYTTDGNLLIFGKSDSPNDGDKSEDTRGREDMWILKINQNGTVLWDKRYGGNVEDSCSNAIALPDGGFLLIGTSRSFAGGDKSENRYGGDEDIWVIRIDASGNKLWDKRYGGSGGETSVDAISLHDGGFALFSERSGPADYDLSENSRGYTDYMLLKIDDNGTLIWQKHYGGGHQDSARTFISTQDGGFLLGGHSLSGISGEVSEEKIGSGDFWIVKTDSNGTQIWDKKYGGSGNEGLFDILQKSNGNYLLFGQSQSGVSGNKTTTNLGGWDYWLVEINPDGEKVDEKRLGGNTTDNGRLIIPSHDKGFILGGRSWSGISDFKSENNRGGPDSWITKLDPNGNKSLEVSDPDGDVLTWSITGGVDASDFSINAATGDLTLTSTDFENPADADFNNVYEVTLTVTDTAGLSASKSISISIIDENESPVALQSISPLSIQENLPAGTTIGHFRATDPDGDELTYQFINGENNNSHFSLDLNGTLTTATEFDYEMSSSLTLKLEVRDEFNASLENTFSVFILNENEAPLNLTSGSPLTIYENKPNGTTIGNLSATDPEGKNLNYTLSEGNSSLFSLSTDGTLKAKRTFDFETDPIAHTIKVKASDPEGLYHEKSFGIEILNANEPPVLIRYWDRTFGGSGVETLNDGTKTSDGGYLLVGSSDSSIYGEKSESNRGGKDFWVVKVDPSGNHLWDKTYGGSGDDTCIGVTTTSDGNLLLFGSSDSPDDGDKTENTRGRNDMWIVKINQNGNKLWDRRYGGNVEDSCSNAIALPDGGFLLSGSSRSFAGGDKTENRYAGNSDVWLVRIDALGNKLWDKRYGGSGGENSVDSLATSDGGFVLFCTSSSGIADHDLSETGRGYTDFLLLKIDSKGDLLWQKRYGGDLQDSAKSFIPTLDGGYLMAGYSYSGVSGEVTHGKKGGSDMWIIKTDANGSKVWDQRFGGSRDDRCFDLHQKPNGNYVLFGQSQSGSNGDKSTSNLGGWDYWWVEINSDGKKVSEKRFGGELGDNGRIIIRASDDEFLVGGHSWSGHSESKSQSKRGNSDFWIIKTDAYGNRNHSLNDPDGDSLTWSISGGPDAALLVIDPVTGELALKNSVDHENPVDADNDNIFEVNVRVTDPKGLFSETKSYVGVGKLFKTIVETLPSDYFSQKGATKIPVYSLNSTQTLTLADGYEPASAPAGYYTIEQENDSGGENQTLLISVQKNSLGNWQRVFQFYGDDYQAYPIYGVDINDWITTHKPEIEDYLIENEKTGNQQADKPTDQFLGQIISTGGKEIHSFGFIWSEHFSFENPKTITGQFLNDLEDENIFAASKPEGDFTNFYYRAYATNEDETTYGSTKRFQLTNVKESFWWNQFPVISGQWRSSWLGNFIPYENGWIYHLELGWIYVWAESKDGLWMWVKGYGWLWTKETVWPYLFNYSHQDWIYLIQNKKGSSIFYSWEQERIIHPIIEKLPGKKGVCFTLRTEPKNGKPADAEDNFKKIKMLNPSWNYSWGGSKILSGQPENVEFVPMTFGSGRSLAHFEDYINRIRTEVEKGDFKRVLAFNEPDKEAQANMPVEAALVRWPILESLGIPLCSPSCANAEGITDESNQGVEGTWMNEFMQEADRRGYRVDYIGVHWYGGINVDAFKAKMERIYLKYGKRPLLLTEFGPADWKANDKGFNSRSPDQILNWMKQILPWLEKTEWISGYAWFPFSIDSLVGTSSALFDKDGNLTAAGKYYQSITPENPSGDQSIQVE